MSKEFIEKLIERLEREKWKSFYASNSIVGEKNVWGKAIEIVRQLAEEYKNSQIEQQEEPQRNFYEERFNRVQ